MRTVLALAFGVLLGFFTVIILPYLLIAWLAGWWEQVVGTPVVEPVRCDGGEEGTPLPERDVKRLTLEEVPLPACVEAWMAKKGLR